MKWGTIFRRKVCGISLVTGLLFSFVWVSSVCVGILPSAETPEDEKRIPPKMTKKIPEAPSALENDTDRPALKKPVTVDDLEDEIESSDLRVVLISIVIIVILGGGAVLVGARKKRAVWDEKDKALRNISPPKIDSKVIGTDDSVPPIYIVSDFHIGSDEHHKHNSNDMGQATLKKFIHWLKSVDNDARFAPHYDVIMNGDFLDLWQAFRPKPKKDTYKNRLIDILKSNEIFFSRLGGFVSNNHRCHFHYLFGNHDDPLVNVKHNPKIDPHFEKSSSSGDLKKIVSAKFPSNPKSRLVPPIGRVWTYTTFIIKDSYYYNDKLKVWVEHGHRYDDDNLRKKDGTPAGGQELSEYFNELQQKWPAAFKDIDKVPEVECVKHMRCLVDNPKTPSSYQNEVKKLKNVTLKMKVGKLAQIIDLVFTNNFIADLAQSEVKPKNKKAKYYNHVQNDVDVKKKAKIAVLAHTHLFELRGGGTIAYANTGSWLERIKSVKNSRGYCALQLFPSYLPYVKISKVKDKHQAAVELKFFSGKLEDKTVIVDLS